MPSFDYYGLTQSEFSSAVIVINLILSFLIQLGVVWVYRRTHRSLSYSQSFIFTLVLIGVIGTAVMMVVQNNLVGAFALLGAFSLIRFRTIVKETRDVAFVFFSLAEGVAVGTNNYPVALIAFVLISLMILFLDRFNFASAQTTFGYLLTFTAEGELLAGKFREALEKNAASYELLQSKVHEGNLKEYTFAVKLKKLGETETLLNSLRALDLRSIELITGKHSVEY